MQKDVLKLYDHSNFNELLWPQEAQYEKDYLSPFFLSGTKEYVSNVWTRMFVLATAKHLFPLTVNDHEYDNSYICSPFTRYITYAKQELGVLNQPFLRSVLSASLSGLGSLLKVGKINQVVCVNNWLLSTNLYPNLVGESLEDITQFLVTSFPKHTIMFPSLNQRTNEPLLNQLQQLGYQLVPSREVFIFDQSLKDFTNRRATKVDFDLLKKTSYQIVSHEDLSEKDYPRIVELYNHLYIDKYSNCNPKFTPSFIQLCHEKSLMNFQGLRKRGGELVGIIASFHRNGILATPFLGYDMRLPPKEGLYRILTALSMKEALEKDLIFNMSSGVSEFKKWRGGVGFVEYCAVYDKHLPLYKRKTWNFLQLTMTRIGVPFLHKYKF